ncbi:beta-xylosidase [Parabacteroides sp. PFB2-10]|uniref:family 43 glycosylhydrolase n=1 Tax=Parabacteroides sp. PFB2-10 TaxID=1742405 RepID=UPI00247CFCDD|nr:beta-xylosidase [Parabacteroides sp. PFB2-10]
MKEQNRVLLTGLLLLWSMMIHAWPGMPTPRLHVEGRYLKDPHGNTVNLHGFAQTYSPYFNERGQYWNNYDVAGCLRYNKSMIDGIMAADWKMSFLRLHMDPYWSSEPGCSGRYEGEECFSETRFRKYLDEVFIPMAEYAISKGLYVIMRPPGVCPEEMGKGDVYNEYLLKVWDIVSSHPKIKSMEAVMFELANEPIRIRLADGTVGANSQPHFDVLKEIFQPIVDRIRANGFHNVLWIPGSGYQSQYKGYAVNPIEGENIGYAIHIYPGWFGSANGYAEFKKEWDANVKPVADFAPITVTEMDWADEKYEASWGKGHTGTAGGDGFGANFKKITDDSGNVSWLIFTDANRLAQFSPTPPAQGVPYTFLNDPEACPWPAWHWYQEYAKTEYPRPAFSYQSHSDNGDGTFTNPVIHADFPDPDVIRVGDVYYMVSTTMHIFPGATLLKSYDLVNWSYCSNPLELIESSDAYNLLNGKDRYSQGQWASSLKYHNGKFYILFNTLSEGGYLLTATDPEGPWDLRHLTKGFYDPGLHFDDNGKVYVVHGINTLTMTELDKNFEALNEQEVVSRPNTGLEGSHLYKIGDYYYIYATYGGWPASQTVFRSTNIFGPYEEKKLLDEENIHQGALVETQTGEWWTMLFYDKGPYGRLPNLQPVSWTDNWPVIGVNGTAVKTYRKPNVGKEYPITTLPTNDNFRNYKLGMQWGWNHNPDNANWSLFENPGHLRLKTGAVVSNLLEARNTLTQRVFGYHSSTKNSYGTISLDISHMKEGDIAGLTVFQDPYAYIGIQIENGQKKLIWKKCEIEQAETVADVTQTEAIDCGSKIYLRAVANYGTGKARFYYSTDNSTYLPFGDEYTMQFKLSVFVGIRFGIFNFATAQTGGYVDVDWFSTEETFEESTYYDDSFTGYTEDEITIDKIYTDSSVIDLLIGTSQTLKLSARFKDGHTENITTQATYTISEGKVASIANGQLISISEGTTTVTASFSDRLGNTQRTTFEVAVHTFPFISGLFNPSIFGNGTFDQATRTLITSQWGAGGWRYSNGVDLSAFKYLVVELDAVQDCGTELRLFDENSYWSSCASYRFDGNLRVVVDLHAMRKGENANQVCDPSHLYYICFWSHGNRPIDFKKAYVTNSDNYEDPTGIEKDILPQEDLPVDVYTITGIKVRSQVLKSKATEGLPAGIYIVGREKVMVLR